MAFSFMQLFLLIIFCIFIPSNVLLYANVANEEELQTVLPSEEDEDDKDDEKETSSAGENSSPDLSQEFYASTVTNGVVLQGLDKMTARVFTIEARVGDKIEFGTLEITVNHCHKTSPEEFPESIAFVEISEKKEKDDNQNKKLFSSWMFASTPAVSMFQHPVYGVWIKECKNLPIKQ